METKCCANCQIDKPLDAFEFNTKKLSNGTFAHYRRGTCSTCRWMTRSSKPIVTKGPVWQRPAYERECDLALMGWRQAGAAFQGPRL